MIMVTAKSEESDIVVGLELGADDYLTKLFSPKVLLSRIRVCLRRMIQKPADKSLMITIGELVINPGYHTVSVDGKPVELTRTEFGILHLLASHPGWVFTRYRIVEVIWGKDYTVTDRVVDVQIVGLRKKLASYSSYIETVRGIGYRFKEQACNHFTQ